MKKTLLLATLALSFAGRVFSQEYVHSPRTYDFELSDMAKRIIPVLAFNANMHKNGWVWKEGRSSALIEKGKPADFYEINKINDAEYLEAEGGDCEKVDTAWVEGVKGDGIGEWVIIPVEPRGDAIEHLSTNGTHSTSYDVSFYMNNGYQQSKDLYRKNNRVKEAKVSIYIAAYSCGQDDAYLLWNPDCIYENVFTISDEIQFHPFCLNYDTHSFPVNLPEKYTGDINGSMQFFMKFEILSVYKGSKYDDTCISNLTATVDMHE